jgi:tetratricopeptide (TPR) repeat protein
MLRRAESLLDRLPISRRRRLRKLVHLRQRIAEAHSGVGEYETARQLYRSSLLLCEELDDMIGVAVSLGHLGDVAFVRAEFENAQSIFQRALEIYERYENTAGIARTLNRLGDIAFEQGDQDKARQLYQQSLTLSREIGEDWGLAGSLRVRQSQPASLPEEDAYEERQLFQQSLVAHRQTGNQYGIADALYNLGLVEHNRKEYAAAERYLREAVLVYQMLEDVRGTVHSYTYMAASLLAQGQHDAARTSLTEALAHVARTAQYSLSLRPLLQMAHLDVAQSRLENALYLLAFLLYCPDSPEPMQEEAENLIFQLEIDLPEHISERAWEAGKQADYDTIISQFLP